MIAAPDAFEEENIVATESALGALAKLTYFHKDGTMITDSVVQGMLSKFPLKNEEEEAQKSHKLLFEMILKNNPAIMGESTKASVKEALMRIKAEAESNKEMTLVDEEGMTMLTKVLSM